MQRYGNISATVHSRPYSVGEGLNTLGGAVVVSFQSCIHCRLRHNGLDARGEKNRTCKRRGVRAACANGCGYCARATALADKSTHAAAPSSRTRLGSRASPCSTSHACSAARDLKAAVQAACEAVASNGSPQRASRNPPPASPSMCSESATTGTTGAPCAAACSNARCSCVRTQNPHWVGGTAHRLQRHARLRTLLGDGALHALHSENATGAASAKEGGAAPWRWAQAQHGK